MESILPWPNAETPLMRSNSRKKNRIWDGGGHSQECKFSIELGTEKRHYETKAGDESARWYLATPLCTTTRTLMMATMQYLIFARCQISEALNLLSKMNEEFYSKIVGGTQNIIVIARFEVTTLSKVCRTLNVSTL